MVEMEGTAEIPHNEVRKEKRSDQSRRYRQRVRHRKGAPDNTDRLMFACFGTPRDTSSVTLTKGGP
jgi:hypothetical protein